MGTGLIRPMGLTMRFLAPPNFQAPKMGLRQPFFREKWSETKVQIRLFNGSRLNIFSIHTGRYPKSAAWQAVAKRGSSSKLPTDESFLQI